MKPSLPFLRLLPGALALTTLRTDLEGEAAQVFNKQAATCQTIDDVLSLIGNLPDRRADSAAPMRLGSAELFLQGSCLSINLKTVGLGCELRLRIRKIGQTNAADADCLVEFDGDCHARSFSDGKETGKALAGFVAKASESGQALTAEAALLWLKQFGATPTEAASPKKTSNKKLELAGARA